MTAHILVVDDEPDVEALILQKFRHKIRGGAITFLFARDGVEALAALKANGQIDLVGSMVSSRFVRNRIGKGEHAPFSNLIYDAVPVRVFQNQAIDTTAAHIVVSIRDFEQFGSSPGPMPKSRRGSFDRSSPAPGPAERDESPKFPVSCRTCAMNSLKRKCKFPVRSNRESPL
jgi:hypothetical protein